MRGKRWTLKEAQRAQQLKAMGYSGEELAKEFNRSVKSIYELTYAIRKGKLHAKEES